MKEQSPLCNCFISLLILKIHQINDGAVNPSCPFLVLELHTKLPSKLYLKNLWSASNHINQPLLNNFRLNLSVKGFGNSDSISASLQDTPDNLDQA